MERATGIDDKEDGIDDNENGIDGEEDIQDVDEEDSIDGEEDIHDVDADDNGKDGDTENESTEGTKIDLTAAESDGTSDLTALATDTRNQRSQTLILQYPFNFKGGMANINKIERYLTEDLVEMFPLHNDGSDCNNEVSYDTRTGGDVLDINDEAMKRLGNIRESTRISAKRGGRRLNGKITNGWLNDEVINLWMKW